MTLAQVREHSLAQLKLLRAAAARLRAADGILELRISLAAATAPWGGNMAKDVENELQKVLHQ